MKFTFPSRFTFLEMLDADRPGCGLDTAPDRTWTVRGCGHIYHLACGAFMREISAMKRPEPDGKCDTADSVKREDFEDFDYYWQHLRRNFGYCMAVGGIGWNETANHSFRGSRRIYLNHQYQEFHACCLLPTPVGAGIENSEQALREVLEKKPDFFQTAQWQTIKAKASAAEPVAYWNFVGYHRSAWRDYHEGQKFESLWKDPQQDYYECFAFRKDTHHPERHDVGEEFMHLQINLEIKEQDASNEKRIEYWAKQHGRTIEEERKLKQAEHDEAQARMKKFLEAHPRMDFVADTRLPWATVSRAMEAEWDRIKDLRCRVGLEANEQPPRKREWKKQLEVYDAYFPHWLENRKKIAALPRIWRENLGFQESFKLLQVELTPEAAELAQCLDKRGLKPKGIFRLTAKVLNAMEQSSRTKSSSPDFLFENRRPVPVTNFDYDAVDAPPDGAAEDDYPGSIGLGVTARIILPSWRPHFSIPKPKLPANVAKMSADKRREWFRVARARIEALWPPVDYDDVT
jgi:hypothetical protein